MLKLTTLQSTPTLLIVIIVFILIVASYVIGHRIRSRTIRKDPDLSKVNLGAINGTLLGLLGLLLAFTFNMSSSRFDTRRRLAIDEANNIRTVILRSDIYPDSVRKLLRANLKDYVEERIAFYETGLDAEKMIRHYGYADAIGKKVWNIVATYAKNDRTTRTSQLIPAMTDMINVTTLRRAAGESTVPDSILYFLFILCLCSAFLLGYDHKDKIDWIVVIGFAIMLSATVFNIIDLDRPRSGLISMDIPNQKLVELREMFAE